MREFGQALEATETEPFDCVRRGRAQRTSSHEVLLRVATGPPGVWRLRLELAGFRPDRGPIDGDDMPGGHPCRH